EYSSKYAPAYEHVDNSRKVGRVTELRAQKPCQLKPAQLLFLMNHPDHVGKRLKTHEPIVNYLLPLWNLTIKRLLAKICEGDVSLLHSDYRQVLSGVDYWEQLVKGNPEVDCEVRYVRLAVIRP